MPNETTANSVLKALVKQNAWKVHLNSEHRLLAAFVWHRALLHSDAFSDSALQARVAGDLNAVSAYVQVRLGADRKSGPMLPFFGGVGEGSPAHLDLVNLSRVMVSDLQVDIDSQTDVRAELLRLRAAKKTHERIRRFLAIVWRATFIHPQLWSNTALDAVALDEIVDRRLRAVERMSHNVSSIQEMHNVPEDRSIAPSTWDMSDATASRNWRDGTRVRLFEYPNVPQYIEDLLPPSEIVQLVQDFTERTGVSELGEDAELVYNVKREAERQYLDDNSTVTVEAISAWRFPNAQDAWQVSVGEGRPIVASSRTSAYRIDLRTSGSGVSALDLAFDIDGQDNGLPVRADYWNRAWLACDQVIPLLFLEGLVFARRRRIGLVAADAEMEALVARRVTVQVPKPPATSGPVETAYVALDKNFYVDGPANKGILMADQGVDGVGKPNDPFFENTVDQIDKLQVGDQVIIGNNITYFVFNPDGPWGFENALVMDVDSAVDRGPASRSRVRLENLILQGHGTRALSHTGYRGLMADILRPSYRRVTELLRATIQDGMDNGTPVSPIQSVGIAGTALIRWAPFRSDNRIEFSPGQQPLPSDPWWMYVNINHPLFGGDADKALQGIPKSVGGGMLSSGQNGEPTMNPLPSGSGPAGSFPPIGFTIDNFFAQHVLIPLFEPVLRLRRDDRVPWSVYFKRAKVGGGITSKFRPIKIDHQVVPGLRFMGNRPPVGVVRPRVAPEL